VYGFAFSVYHNALIFPPFFHPLFPSSSSSFSSIRSFKMAKKKKKHISAFSKLRKKKKVILEYGLLYVSVLFSSVLDGWMTGPPSFLMESS
jgi:hypothetical protein